MTFKYEAEIVVPFPQPFPPDSWMIKNFGRQGRRWMLSWQQMPTFIVYKFKNAKDATFFELSRKH